MFKKNSSPPSPAAPHVSLPASLDKLVADEMAKASAEIAVILKKYGLELGVSHVVQLRPITKRN